jgi:hypothetical protein
MFRLLTLRLTHRNTLLILYALTLSSSSARGYQLQLVMEKIDVRTVINFVSFRHTKIDTLVRVKKLTSKSVKITHIFLIKDAIVSFSLARV